MAKHGHNYSGNVSYDFPMIFLCNVCPVLLEMLQPPESHFVMKPQTLPDPKTICSGCKVLGQTSLNTNGSEGQTMFFILAWVSIGLQ